MTRLGLVAAVIWLAACSISSKPSEPTVTSTSSEPTVQEWVGSFNPDVNQATIGWTICVPGWTATVRPPSSYTSPLERRQIAELGLPGGPADYEEDHLMPLALGGGTDDPWNLRPVPLERARRDDVWERRLHDGVCDGTTTLAEAQAQISQIKRDLVP